MENTTALVNVDYHVYEFAGWKLNVTSYILLSPANVIIKLTSAEHRLLKIFVQHPQHVLSRNQLLDKMNADSNSYDRSVDILISRIRAKMGVALIQTIRNSGYSLSCVVTKTVMDSTRWQDVVSSA